MKKVYNIWNSGLIIFLLAAYQIPALVYGADSILPTIYTEFESAFTQTRGDTLIVGTGQVQRTWKWTGKGFVTIGLTNLETGREWTKPSQSIKCDWAIEDLIDSETAAELKNLSAKPVRYDPYTSDHLEIVGEMDYPSSKLTVKYVIWAYPNAPGIRTQLMLKGMTGYKAINPNISIQDSGNENEEMANTAQSVTRVDYLPVEFNNIHCRAAGYYNRTDGRNSKGEEIIREHVYADPIKDMNVCDWSSILAFEKNGEGLCFVKESQKCVNTPGHDTGAFEYNARGVIVTGSGLEPHEILTDRYRACWATWVVLYEGGEDEKTLALKMFDRQRYPIDPERDIYIMANTWGSTKTAIEGQKAAREENIFREIESQADLGIDVQQIDDGWQNPPDLRWFYTKEWYPHPARYPEGWKNVRKAAKEQGIKLGLWAASMMGNRANEPGRAITLDELKQNFDTGGFSYFKLDFSYLDSHEKIESLMNRVRSLIEYSGHTVRVNWDVTNKWPRVGYFFAREYGNIYLENRKESGNNAYKPALVLRDAWHVSKYINLNRFQIPIQNIDRVNKKDSNAYKYNHAYCVAISLMGSPIFFQETHYYTEKARQQIRPLIALYKKHRRQMFEGYVFPIGNKPDDASWTGFQNFNPENGIGYLIIFREVDNQTPRKKLRLKFLSNMIIQMTNLENESTRTLNVPDNGLVEFTIEKPADYLFIKYNVKQN